MSTSITPLYHASISGITGLVFNIGSSLYFTPVDDAQVYRVEDQAALTLTAEVEASVAAFLATTILEPRLLALAERRVA
jgi:hypothetical protein